MKILISFFYLPFLTVSNFGLTFAAVDPSGTRSPGTPGIRVPGTLLPDSSKDMGDSIGSIIGWTIGLSAVLTIMAVTWAGINMVLAVGEEEKMKKARQTMIYAFIGLIISGLAYGAVSFVTNLKLNSFL